MKRKHSKIDKLPSDIKEAVEQMILGDYTYRDVWRARTTRVPRIRSEESRWAALTATSLRCSRRISS